MKIDGKMIAQHMQFDITQDARKLNQKGIEPTLAVILVGYDPASISYIKQKQKVAQNCLIQLVLKHFPKNTTLSILNKAIEQYNNDPAIHGLIIQRPLPKEFGDVETTLRQVKPEKDVDGFVPNTVYDPPIAKAVIYILKEVHRLNNDKQEFSLWLRNQSIVVIGRGETAGLPIASSLQKLHCTTSIIHSKTVNPQNIINHADIVISCVGKERVVKKEDLTPGVILISVGLWRDRNGKLHGDYEEEEVKDVVAFYTPTPGGVGPINVACLMENVVTAAKSESEFSKL